MKFQYVGKWEPLLIPRRYCLYINDHTIFKDKEGRFRLLGTCADSDYAFYKERSFIEAVTSDLEKPMRELGLKFRENPNKGIKIAPHVYYEPQKKIHHLYFGPMIIRHYVSENGVIWKKEDDAVKGFWPFSRDPHVIKYKNKYLMYLTDRKNTISVWESNDLYSWKKYRTAFKVGAGYPRSFNSSCESPFVLGIKRGFLLLTTIVPSGLYKKENLKNYNNTVVFYSKDPFDFGVYSRRMDNSAKVISKLDAHACEVINWKRKIFITTCGWKDCPKPEGVRGEGVFIREVKII